jgi:hypothetical protein
VPVLLVVLLPLPLPLVLVESVLEPVGPAPGAALLSEPQAFPSTMNNPIEVSVAIRMSPLLQGVRLTCSRMEE